MPVSHGLKISQACKPGSVFHSIIYLGLMLPTASSSLPPAISLPEGTEPERAAPCPRGLAVYLALQPMRRTAACVTTSTGGLLPRLFTLVRPDPDSYRDIGMDGYFLLRCYGFTPVFPLGSMAPFVARTFLPGCPRR